MGIIVYVTINPNAGDSFMVPDAVKPPSPKEVEKEVR